MTQDVFHCGICPVWITYCVELYGTEGPIPLHHVLTHETSEGPAVNGPLTVGLVAELRSRLMAPEASVPMLTHYDTVKALRSWGQDRLADDLLRVVTDHILDHDHVREHYSSLAVEAMGERVAISSEKLDDLLLERAELRAEAPAETGWLDTGMAS